MEVSFRMFNRGKLSTKSLGKKFWVPVFVLAIAAIGFGIYSAVRAVTPYNSNVSIASTSSYRGYSYDGEYPIYYGNNESSDWKPWSTKWYSVDGNDAMCLQASKNSPAGSGPALDYSNTLRTKLIRVMLATVPSYSDASVSAGGPNYYNEFRNDYDWDSVTAGITNLRTRDNNIVYGCSDCRADCGNGICQGGSGEEKVKYSDYYYGCSNYYAPSCTKTLANSQVNMKDAIFAVGHMMGSGIYSGDYYGISSKSSNIQGVASDIDWWFANHYPNAHEEYNIYISYTSDPTKQTVGWLEYVGRPDPTRIRICKKAAGTGTMLSGATFLVLGQYVTTGSNGCTGWIEVDSSSVDYTETAAPSGYQLYSSTQTCTGITDNTDNTCYARDNDLIPKAYIKIKKVNTVNSGVTYAGLTVQGTVFSVKSGSTEVATITIGSDGTGTTNVALPIGTYVISEKTATTGFKTNSATVTVALTSSNTASNPTTVDYTTSSTTCTSGSSPCWFKNEPIVGKVSFTKTGYELSAAGAASHRNLGGISFTAVNKADPSIAYTIGPTAANGSVTSPDMVYGNYTATEIRSDANRAYNLITFDFSVGSGTTSLGTKDDSIPDTPSLTTVARNSNSAAGSPNKKIEISSSASVTDRITCSGLTSGIKYQLRGELYVEGNSSAIKTSTSDFTADSSGKCGNVDMVFSGIDTYPYKGKKLSVKQVLYKNNGSASSADWVRVFIHNANLADTNEQVTVNTIEIATTARSERTNNKQLAVGTVKIKDTYEITGMANGQNYTLKGYVKDSGGNNVATATDNIPMTLATGAKYTGIMTFELNSSSYIGQNLYVYQELYLAGESTPLATHSAPADGSQTVSVLTPTISTVAVDNADGSSKQIGVGNAKVKDTISFTGLVASNTYRLEGKLANVETGATVSTATKTFTASGETGSETMVFDITTDTLIGKKLVVYEYLYYGNNKIAEHAVSTDNGQTVTVKTPTVGTTAVDNADGDKWLEVSDGIVVKDTVTYDGLVAGNSYSLVMKVVRRSNPSTVVATGSKDFSVTATSGTVVVTSAAFDSSLYVGQDLVVYEYLYHGSTQIAKHENKDDTAQIVTVKTPVISTTAVDNADGSSKLVGVGDAKVKDTVHYKELAVGKSYRLVGSLVDVATGNEVASANISSFTPTRSEDDISMAFSITTDALIGKRLVVYEYLYFGNNKVAEHAVSTDNGQTVTVKTPTVGTTAVDNADGDKWLEVSDGIVVKDTVVYDGLVAGNTYSLTMKVVRRSNPATVVATGTKEFTTTATGGSVVVTSAAFDSSFYVSQDLVIYEYLYHGSTQIAKHENKDDTAQIVTVKTPVISTTAVDNADGSSKLVGVGDAKVKDTIHYKELAVGKSYRLEGRLVDVATGTEVSTARISSFTPTRSEDDISMVFDITTDTLIGKKLVVYEYLYFGNNKIAEHVESTDANQTVTVKTPTVGTTAVDNSDGDKLLEVSDGIVVKDTVAYNGLVAGNTYSLEMKVVLRSNPSTVVTTGSKQFTVSATSGTIDVISADFDSSFYVSQDLVVYEYLYHNSTQIAKHEDKDDTPQIVTVKTPEISTIAVDNVDGTSKEIGVGNARVKDTIHYKELAVGKSYRLEGKLVDVATGTVVATARINSFIPTRAEDDIVMTFDRDTSTLLGKNLVVYEYLYFGNNKIAEHEESTDADQTVKVKVPTVGTTAVDNADGDKLLEVDEGIQVKDTVAYTGLIGGDTYKLSMKVVKRSDPTTVIASATKEFQASGASGTVDIVSSAFDATPLHDENLVGIDLVVYEYLYFGENLIGSHEDKDDEPQIVTVKTPTIGTTALDVQNRTRELPVGTTTVVDEVEYHDLVAGREYTLNATLMEKATGNAAKDNSGNDIVGSTTFTATGATGTVDVVFSYFDTTLVYDYSAASQKYYVAYEYLYKKGILIAKHDDLNDEAQSITINRPSLKTSATYKADGSRLLGVGDITMKDYVDYEGLVEGEWYMIVGSIIDPETCTDNTDPTTCEILVIDDEFIRNSKVFKAGEKGKGTVAIEINLNTISVQGRSFVVYERLYRSLDRHGDGRLLATHEDLEDEDQTVTVKVAKIETTATDKADGDNVLIYEDGQVIHDVIEYDGLLRDEDYILYGFLWDKVAEQPLLDKDGNKIETTLPFTTPTRRDNGTLEVDFNVDAHDIPGAEIVVFEYLFQGTEIPLDDEGNIDFSKIVTKHDDPESASQTVRVSMRIGTTAADSYDGNQVIGVGNAEVIDTLMYEGARVGKTYKAKGWLVDQETGEKVQGTVVTIVHPECLVHVCDEEDGEECDDETDDEGGESGSGGESGGSGSEEGGDEESGEGDGEEEDEEEPCDPYERTLEDIEGEKTFVIGEDGYESNGSVLITFEFDSRNLAGKKLVVFEELYLIHDDGTEELVAEHKDVEDESQTIEVAVPKIRTIARDKADNDKELANNVDSTIVDEVEYSGLIPGTSYMLYGQLMNKQTGEPLDADGNVDDVHIFTATRDAGMETLEFTISTTGLDGQEIVVFETLYIEPFESEEDDKIAEHKDLNDDNQTVWVRVTKKPDTGFFTRMTEGVNPTRWFIILGGTAIIVLGTWGFLRLKKRRSMRF